MTVMNPSKSEALWTSILGVVALVTGTTNLTTTGLEKSHNHMLFLRGVPGLLDAFHEELSQLYDHCRSAKVGSRQCTECTPGCMQAPTISGPWTVGTGSVDVDHAELGERLTGIYHFRDDTIGPQRHRLRSWDTQ